MPTSGKRSSRSGWAGGSPNWRSDLARVFSDVDTGTTNGNLAARFISALRANVGFQACSEAGATGGEGHAACRDFFLVFRALQSSGSAIDSLRMRLVHSGRADGVSWRDRRLQQRRARLRRRRRDSCEACPICAPRRFSQSRRWPCTLLNCSEDWARKWCRGAESNCRHHDFQSCALPTELPRRQALARPPTIAQASP